ncbi:hypothetical protein LHYA1_G006710 [Lachnellula hyalina]|uniref:MICOS complex subunit MIC12 n=1 Tax=Lachnellula hyalina TaxID=1316788 RepID=A0A8H8TXA9_9HELO|nr:uncharacterized protein LHYA1_G006710 [Lachnellula hyalina]TVY23737.1 hypothetical protein LHYA1_G006710 [Lachnellula hyalina]
MGFTTGFTGGVTLTLGLAYLTVAAHERNRKSQALALRSQSQVLTSLLDPTPLPPPQTRAELAREERSTLVEAAKDRWNNEIENAVRWVQRTDWTGVREGMEGSLSRLLGGGLQKSREGIEEVEKAAGPQVQEAVDRSKAAAKKAAGQAAVGIDSAAAATISGAERVGAEVKEGASKLAASTKTKTEQVVGSSKEQLRSTEEKSGEILDAAKAKSGRVATNAKSAAQDAAESVRSGGTVDAVRGAVRETFSKGVEKGKEAIGKASAAIGLAEERLESKTQYATLSHSSAVEKALHERYEKPAPLKKTPEEVLEERYKPIEKRDNTVLRGFTMDYVQNSQALHTV